MRILNKDKKQKFMEIQSNSFTNKFRKNKTSHTTEVS